MPLPDITQAEVEDLIAATHAEPPLDPYEPKDEVEARLDRFCWNRSLLAATAVEFWHANHESYTEWTPDNIDIVLSQEVPTERLDELLAGAEPTPGERALFQQRAEEKAAWGIEWCARIYRLTAPHGSREQRAVFFVYVGIELAQNEDSISHAGPFRTMDEAQEYADKQYDGDDELQIEEWE